MRLQMKFTVYGNLHLNGSDFNGEGSLAGRPALNVHISTDMTLLRYVTREFLSCTDRVCRLMHAATSDGAADAAVDGRVTRPRRGRQTAAGVGGGGSIKRFPQFPPGATAAAAKAARAGDTAECQSVSLPALSSTTVTVRVNDVLVTPTCEPSKQHPSPRYDGQSLIPTL